MGWRTNRLSRDTQPVCKSNSNQRMKSFFPLWIVLSVVFCLLSIRCSLQFWYNDAIAAMLTSWGATTVVFKWKQCQFSHWSSHLNHALIWCLQQPAVHRPVCSAISLERCCLTGLTFIIYQKDQETNPQINRCRQSYSKGVCARYIGQCTHILAVMPQMPLWITGVTDVQGRYVIERINNELLSSTMRAVHSNSKLHINQPQCLFLHSVL